MQVGFSFEDDAVFLGIWINQMLVVLVLGNIGKLGNF